MWETIIELLNKPVPFWVMLVFWALLRITDYIEDK